LFIECKYVAEGAVFWMDAMDTDRAKSQVFDPGPFMPGHTYNNRHHYFQTDEPVAKLFASEKAKGEDGDPIYRALNQCLNGYIHNQSRGTLVSSSPGEEITTLRYPVIMCSDFTKYYWTSVSKPGDPENLNRNFFLEVDYAYLVSCPVNS
jgi:hypothetical protein